MQETEAAARKNSSDLGASVNVDVEHAICSVNSICRGIQDQIKKVDHRMLVIEKKQDMLADALNDIKDLLNKIKKDSFSIKGSPFEVCTNYLYLPHIFVCEC